MRDRRDDLSKAASHADSPRNSVTTTPSSPVMSARTRLAGTPESMRACEEARGEELRQLTMRGYEAAVRIHAEQVGPQRPQQRGVVTLGNVLEAEAVGVFRRIDGNVLLVGQQEECREVAGRSHDPVEREEWRGALNRAVLIVALASQGTARTLERGAAVAGPFVTPHGLDQQPERVRVGEQPLQAALTGLTHETARIRDAEVGEDAQDVLAPERFEVQDADIPVARGRDDFLQVVSTQPVGRPARESEVGAPEAFEPLEDQVHGPAGVRAARTDFVQSVDEERLRAPLRMPSRLREMKRRAGTRMLPGTARLSVPNASVFPAPGSPSNT